jgi:DNA-binding NarL/FixJ family response regulator
LQQAQTLLPNIVLMDLSMPRLNGLDAAAELQRTAPMIRTILLTMHFDKPYVLQALKAGVRGYVLKSQAADDLMRAIHEVMAGEVYLSPSIMGSVVDEYLGNDFAGNDRLTPRELQTLQLVAEGKTTKDIAALLNISFKTAETHRGRMMKKLGVHDITGVIRYAIRQGLLLNP